MAFLFFIRRETFEVALIATPPSSHAALVKTALLAGKHIIVEKPFSTKADDLDECLALAKAQGRIIYLAYHSVFGVAYQAAKRIMLPLLEKGDVIVKSHVQCCENVKKYHSGNAWIFNPEIAGGGALIDCGVNLISVLLDLLGPLDVESVKLVTPPDHQVEKEVTCNFVTREKRYPASFFYDWLALDQPEEGLFSFEFQSGKKVEFEWVSGKVNVFEHGVLVSSSENDVQSNILGKDVVPMDLEYVALVKDSLLYFKGEKSVDNDAFVLTMQCYAYARNHQ